MPALPPGPGATLQQVVGADGVAPGCNDLQIQRCVGVGQRKRCKSNARTHWVGEMPPASYLQESSPISRKELGVQPELLQVFEIDLPAPGERTLGGEGGGESSRLGRTPVQQHPGKMTHFTPVASRNIRPTMTNLATRSEGASNERSCRSNP